MWRWSEKEGGGEFFFWGGGRGGLQDSCQFGLAENMDFPIKGADIVKPVSCSKRRLIISRP